MPHTSMMVNQARNGVLVKNAVRSMMFQPNTARFILKIPPARRDLAAYEGPAVELFDYVIIIIDIREKGKNNRRLSIMQWQPKLKIPI